MEYGILQLCDEHDEEPAQACSKCSRDCNYCRFTRLKTKYGRKRLNIIPKPSEGFPYGRGVYLDGKQIAWYGALPQKCQC